MVTKIILLAAFAILPSSLAAENSSLGSGWLGSVHFHENYLFKWKRDDTNKVLTVRVEVKTKGWVGFGFSSHGLMTKSDLVIGWVDEPCNSAFFLM